MLKLSKVLLKLDKETDPEEVRELPKVTQQAGSRA